LQKLYLGVADCLKQQTKKYPNGLIAWVKILVLNCLRVVVLIVEFVWVFLVILFQVSGSLRVGVVEQEKKLVPFLRKTVCTLSRKQIEFCFDCAVFPCENLEKIDRYYRQKYGSGVIENFVFIKTHGMVAFLKSEKEKWKCPACGGVLCIHTERCYACNP